MGLRGDFEPVVDRRDRLEVPERTLASGAVRTPVNLNAVRASAAQLLEQGCAAVSILFANSYANPENEVAAVAVVRECWPNAHVSASSEILPEIREFERFSTTALNAYLQPELSGYLGRLELALKAGGFDAMEYGRKGMLQVFEQIIDLTLSRRRERDMGIQTLFGELSEEATFDERPTIPEMEFE